MDVRDWRRTRKDWRHARKAPRFAVKRHRGYREILDRLYGETIAPFIDKREAQRLRYELNHAAYRRM